MDDRVPYLAYLSALAQPVADMDDFEKAAARKYFNVTFEGGATEFRVRRSWCMHVFVSDCVARGACMSLCQSVRRHERQNA